MSKGGDVAAHSALMHALVESVLNFMIRTGMSPRDIQASFQNCLLKLGAQSRKGEVLDQSGVSYGCDTVAGAVLRAWHRFPGYLDSSARPLAIKATGPKPSLFALIRSQDKGVDPKELIQAMKSAGLLKRTKAGSYLPTKESATIDALDPMAVDHIAKTVMRLVETATRNIEKSRTKISLIERYAHIPDLDLSESKEFASFSKEQGQACLDAIEDWLEARQVKRRARTAKSTTDSVNAGVHIFAFLGEPARDPMDATRKRTPKRATPSREARV